MERRQVLIVDDYPGARYPRSRILSEAGYEVVEASSGNEALAIARSVVTRCDPARCQPSRHQRVRGVRAAETGSRHSVDSDHPDYRRMVV